MKLFSLSMILAVNQVLAVPTGVDSIVPRADGVILDAIKGIDAKVLALDEAITATPLNADAVVKQSNVLLKAIQEGIRISSGEPELTFDEGISLTPPTQTLVADTEMTIEDLIGIKSQVVAKGLGCTTLHSLEDQFAASTELANVISSKVPPMMEDIAKDLANKVSAAIQNGIDAYDSTCTSSSSAPTSTKPTASKGSSTPSVPTSTKPTASKGSSSPSIPTSTKPGSSAGSSTPSMPTSTKPSSPPSSSTPTAPTCTDAPTVTVTSVSTLPPKTVTATITTEGSCGPQETPTGTATTTGGSTEPTHGGGDNGHGDGNGDCDDCDGDDDGHDDNGHGDGDCDDCDGEDGDWDDDDGHGDDGGWEGCPS